MPLMAAITLGTAVPSMGSFRQNEAESTVVISSIYCGSLVHSIDVVIAASFDEIRNSSHSPPSPVAVRSSNSEVLDRLLEIAPSPLLQGENEADYSKLAAFIGGAAKPRDAIEEFLVRDLIDLTWEILRLRRTKAGILKASMSDGIREVLDGLGYGQDEIYGYTKRLGQSWAAGDKKSRKEVTAALSAAGLTIDELTAKTLESKLDSFERLDRMLASAEASTE
jgi:hypothetical protein